MSISRSWLSAGMLAVLSSCTRTIGNGGRSDPGGMGAPDPTEPPSGAPAAGGSPGPAGGGGAGGKGSPAIPAAIGPGRLRRLTKAQLDNTLRDLLGPAAASANLPLPDADGVASVAATYA